MNQEIHRLFASRLLGVIAVLLACLFFAHPSDVHGAEDHPLVGRFEGAEIFDYEQKAFDEYYMVVAPILKSGLENNAENVQRLEGKITRITYTMPEDASVFEVFRAYQNVLEDSGFDELFECSNECGHKGRFWNLTVLRQPISRHISIGEDFRYLAAQKSRPEGDVFVVLTIGQRNTVAAQVDVIEIEPMERQVVVVKAEEMASQIEQHGSIALYGLYFDTNQATIKSESAPTLDEIGRLLTTDPGLEVLVVGHTDNQGDFDYNVDLSKRRAVSVIQALVDNHGIERSRLKPWGAGYSSPVASNRSEQGRALNRRVVLVNL